MASSRETNTMSEGLRKMLSEITNLKTMPDSDLPFLINLETQILDYLRTPTAATQGGQPLPGGPMGGGPMGMMPQAPPGTPAGGGIGMGAGMPNPDELRRVLQQ